MTERSRREELVEHSRRMRREELRATARATAEREIDAAITALEAVVELAGEIPGREGSAVADAITLLGAARIRLSQADTIARRS